MNVMIAPIPHRQSGTNASTVPLSPEALAQLYGRYLELKESGRLPETMSFDEYYRVWRSGRRGGKFMGLDDGALTFGPAGGIELIDRPPKQLKGVIQTLVLLVDFPDKPHDENLTAGYYEQMLFSDGAFPTGSMRDYYRGVSNWDAA